MMIINTQRSRAFRCRVIAALSAVESRVRTTGHGLMETYPWLTVPILRAWFLYVLLYIRALGLKNALTYEAGTDPFELYQVDPDTIRYKATPFPKAKFKYAGRVMGGDWDTDCELFEETDLYRSFEAHFRRGVDWTETEFFQRIVGEIEGGRTRWDCSTREEFAERCAALDELYEEIETNGYKTQAEILAENIEEPIQKLNRFSKVQRFVYDEMTVSVGRNGDLIFNDARDRLALVKLLDLDTVPVWIMVRHPQWQRLRDAVVRGEVDLDELPDELRTHPDLRNLRPRE